MDDINTRRQRLAENRRNTVRHHSNGSFVFYMTCPEHGRFSGFSEACPGCRADSRALDVIEYAACR